MTTQSYLRLCSHERVLETLAPMEFKQFASFVNSFDPPQGHFLAPRCWEEIAREALRRLAAERGRAAELKRQIEAHADVMRETSELVDQVEAILA